jgi:hypothetical protein
MKLEWVEENIPDSNGVMHHIHQLRSEEIFRRGWWADRLYVGNAQIQPTTSPSRNIGEPHFVVIEDGVKIHTGTADSLQEAIARVESVRLACGDTI